jgi:hypothetical protein
MTLEASKHTPIILIRLTQSNVVYAFGCLCREGEGEDNLRDII